MKKVSVLLSALLISSVSFAQFVNGSVEHSIPNLKTKSWKGFRVSYDVTNAETDLGDGESEELKFKGFSVGYVHSFNIVKNLPLFIETGLSFNYSKWSESYDDLYFVNGIGDYEEKEVEWGYTTMGLTVPINVAYKFTFDDFYVIPYTGFYARVNLTAKEFDEDVEDDGSITKDKLNLFDKDELAEWDYDENNAWNRINGGWQIGASIGYKIINVGVNYALDFNEITEGTKFGTISARLGVNF